jgi:hypothetical protein
MNTHNMRFEDQAEFYRRILVQAILSNPNRKLSVDPQLAETAMDKKYGIYAAGSEIKVVTYDGKDFTFV